MTHNLLPTPGMTAPLNPVQEQISALVTTASPPRTSSPDAYMSTKQIAIVERLLEVLGPNCSGNPVLEALCYTNPKAYQILTLSLSRLFLNPGLYPLRLAMEELVANIKSLEFFGSEIQNLNSDDRMFLFSELLSYTRHEFCLNKLEDVSKVLPHITHDPRPQIEIAYELLSRDCFDNEVDFERHVVNFSKANEGTLSQKVSSYDTMRQACLARAGILEETIFLTNVVRMRGYNPELGMLPFYLPCLPPELCALTHLTELSITAAFLLFLPPEIGKLNQLVKLDLSDNLLSDLPPHIGQLKNLVRLLCGRNLLTRLPAQLANLAELKKLSLYKNRLETLPIELKALTQLKMLELHHNPQMTMYPEVFLHFQNLKRLTLPISPSSDPFSGPVCEWLNHLKSEGCEVVWNNSTST